MCSVSEEGSYLRLIDFVYHSTLGLRVIKKKEEVCQLDVGQHRTHVTLSGIEEVGKRPIGTVLNLRTTTSQKCEAVPRRARI